MGGVVDGLGGLEDGVVVAEGEDLAGHVAVHADAVGVRDFEILHRQLISLLDQPQ